MDAKRYRAGRRRGSLRQFQEELSRRIAAAGTAVREDLRLVVKSGSSGWLLRLPDAGELLPLPELTAVPLTHHWFRGLANVRGVLYAVVDLSAFLGEAPVARQQAARLMLVGQHYGTNSALLVERVIGLGKLQDFTATGRTRSAPWAGTEYLDAGGERWCELEVQALLQAPEFIQAGV
jgi:twitching motility protein PilI